jgi:hypothetical protein
VNPITDVDRDTINCRIVDAEVFWVREGSARSMPAVLAEVVVRGGNAGMWCEVRGEVGKGSSKGTGNGVDGAEAAPPGGSPMAPNPV